MWFQFLYVLLLKYILWGVRNKSSHVALCKRASSSRQFEFEFKFEFESKFEFEFCKVSFYCCLLLELGV